VSGARAFQLLNPAEQEFALNTVVEYAPRAYEWIQNCKATSDGLSIPVVGNEKPASELTAWELEKVQALPVSCVSHTGGRSVSLTIVDGLEEPVTSREAFSSNPRHVCEVPSHYRSEDRLTDSDR
jgi:hypothetical protein